MQPIMTVFQCSCRPSMYPNKTGRYPPQSYGLLHCVPSRKVILCTSLHKACVMEHPDLNQISMGFLSGSICQWEFQEPKMEVLYHIRPYFVVIFTYIGLKNRPYIWNRYLHLRILKYPLISLFIQMKCVSMATWWFIPLSKWVSSPQFLEWINPLLIPCQSLG